MISASGLRRETFWNRAAVVVCFCLLGACKPRLVVQGATVDAIPDAVRLTEMLGLSTADATDVVEGELRVTFASLDSEQRRQLSNALRVIKKGADKAKATRFLLEITETNEKVIEDLKIKRRKIPLELDYARGAQRIKYSKLEQARICTYDVPLSSPAPAMVYTMSFAEAPKDPQEKAIAAVGKVPREVRHRIVASTPQGQAIAEMMEFQGKDAVSFTFSSKFDGSTEEVRQRFGAMPGEYDDCAQLILSKASSLFYVTVLFPTLARTMKSYEIR